jgi:hypothetical protein
MHFISNWEHGGAKAFKRRSEEGWKRVSIIIIEELSIAKDVNERGAFVEENIIILVESSSGPRVD